MARLLYKNVSEMDPTETVAMRELLRCIVHASSVEVVLQVNGQEQRFEADWLRGLEEGFLDTPYDE